LLRLALVAPEPREAHELLKLAPELRRARCTPPAAA
jgi:hypothetical protein